ncbi:MAG: FecR family protein [Panacagrimonas sp.]
MNAMKRILASLSGLLLFCLCSGAAWGAGTVVFVSGTANAQRGTTAVPLAPGVAVLAGDVVMTDAGSFLQMRMDDGALIALKASSQLSIDTYTAPPPSTTQRGGRAVMKLLKGGLRTLTGAIGSLDRQEFELNTPVASIGIRGTDFSLLYCDGDCVQAPDGLHARVSRGAILITNSAGDKLLLSENGYAWVKDGSTPPERRLEAPQEMSLELPPPGTTDTSSRQPLLLAPDDEADSRLLLVQAPLGVEHDVLEPLERRRPAGANLAFAHTPGVDSGVGTRLGDASDAIIGRDGSLNGFNGVDGRYDIGTARQLEVGFDPATGIRWGRWSGGEAVVGGVATRLEDRSLAWIYEQPFDGTPNLPRTGSAEFTLSGNTSPTDTAGNIGFLGSASLSANFSDQTVSSSLSLGIDNTIWRATGTGNLSPDSGLFGGSYDVTVQGSEGGSGQFNGFITPDASGAGLGYSLSNGDSTVSGSAAFRAKGNAQ